MYRTADHLLELGSSFWTYSPVCSVSWWKMLLAACWCSCFWIWTVCVQLILAAKNVSCLEFVIESTSKFSLKILSQEENTVCTYIIWHYFIWLSSLLYLLLWVVEVTGEISSSHCADKVEISWTVMCFCQFDKLRSPRPFIFFPAYFWRSDWDVVKKKKKANVMPHQERFMNIL